MDLEFNDFFKVFRAWKLRAVPRLGKYGPRYTDCKEICGRALYLDPRMPLSTESDY